jgi:hypothetical protein
MQRIASITFGIVLAGLFALGIWFRITSLESMPFPDGDEAWYAVQVAHLLKGKAFEAFTPYANPLNPFFAGMHIPALLTTKPALWLLRVPAVVCGILAIVLTYVLGRKVFDRTTALIASALLAVLPVAIIFSRHAYDASQTPLFTLLAVYFAYRANRLGLILAFVACYIIHPTNVFLLPVVLAVFLVQELRQAAGDRPRQIRVALVTLTVPIVLAIAMGIMTLRRPQLKEMYQPGPKPTLGNHDVLRFLTNCRRLFEGISIDAPVATTRWNDAIFWVPFLTIVGLGTRRLVREKQWEHVALVVGLAASAGGFFVVAGADMLRSSWIAWLRYGLFLVIPTVFVFALSARSLLIEPSTPGRAVLRHGQHAALLAIGLALLCCVKANWFDLFTRDGSESVWTIRTDSVDRYEQAMQTIRRDLRRTGVVTGSRAIITDDHWCQRPLEYLALPRKKLYVISYLIWQGTTDRALHRKLLSEAIRKGSYVVCNVGSPLDNDVWAAFPQETLRRWEIRREGRWAMAVYRLNRDEATASASGGGSRRR